jgi:hypothetical protein
MHVYHASEETEMTSLHPQLQNTNLPGIVLWGSLNRINDGVTFEVMRMSVTFRGFKPRIRGHVTKEVRTIRQSNVPLQVFVDRDQQEGTFNFEQTVSPPGQVSMVSAVMEICTDLQ